MEIRYIGPHAEVELNGINCKHGEAVSFPDDVAKSVCEQETWEPASKPVKAGEK